MIHQLTITANISKGSVLTGSAWVDILWNGEPVNHAEITAKFASIDQVTPDSISVLVDFDDEVHNTLSIINSHETIGPIQIYTIDFSIGDHRLPLNWQTAIKSKPLRFGGQPNITITNPHVSDAAFSGWCSVPDVSPGMSITWGMSDLVNIITSV
jgi:hypothetical protein